jgi:hypothetical protein
MAAMVSRNVFAFLVFHWIYDGTAALAAGVGVGVCSMPSR